MFNRILEEFKKSGLKMDNIEHYIYFCLDNSEPKQKFLTEEHHILPSKVFPNFSNLLDFPWNGVNLSHKNHYIAHSILYNSCNNLSFASAWYAMNNMNTKNGKIDNPKDLIGAELFSELREKRNRLVSENKTKEIILEDGSISTIAKEAGKKISAKRLEIDEKTGKTMASLHNTKSAIKRKNRTINKEGKETSISLRAAAKAEDTMNKKILLDDGTESTIRKELTKGKAIRDEKNSRRFKLLNLFNDSEQILIRKEVIDLHQGLLKTNKDNYLGKHHRSKSNLIKRNLEYLQGSYLIEM